MIDEQKQYELEHKPKLDEIVEKVVRLIHLNCSYTILLDAKKGYHQINLTDGSKWSYSDRINGSIAVYKGQKLMFVITEWQ